MSSSLSHTTSSLVLKLLPYVEQEDYRELLWDCIPQLEWYADQFDRRFSCTNPWFGLVLLVTRLQEGYPPVSSHLVTTSVTCILQALQQPVSSARIYPSTSTRGLSSGFPDNPPCSEI